MDELKMLLVALVVYTVCCFVVMQFLKPHPAWAVLLGLFIWVGTAKAYGHLKWRS